MRTRSLPLASFRRLGLAALAAGLLWLLTGCGGSDSGGPTGNHGGTTTGSLTVTIDGLPGGASGSVTVTGPGGYSRGVTTTETLTALTPGAYSVAAAEAVAGGDRFAPASATASVTVTAGATATTSVSYAIATGAIAITTSGLPTSAQPAFAITGPGGYSRTVGGATTVRGLAPGSYLVRTAALEADGHTWTPATLEHTLQVAASATPVGLTSTFAIATGAITPMLAGLPGGAAGSATVTGPNAFSRTVTSGTTITNLVPGAYQVSASSVTVGTDEYEVPTAVPVTVTPSTTPRLATLQYALASGRLAISFSGLPTGSIGAATVTGPGGYARNVTGAETIAGLAPGAYTVTPRDVVVSGVTWGSPTGAVVTTVGASSTPVAVSFTYAITRGSLSLVINGLPQSIPATVSVTGPGNYAATAQTTQTLAGLAPGTYTITAASAIAGLHTYAATPTSQQVTITASPVPQQATVTYALASAILSITVNGLPNNVPADLTLTGPGGYSHAVTGAELITGLTPGSYTLSGNNVTSLGGAWAPNPRTQVLTIAASTSAQSATVTYSTAIGALAVTINGLPGGTNADVRLTSTGGYNQLVTSSQTLTGLLAGVYTATVASVTASGTTYTSTPATQPVVIGGGVTSSLTITYTAGGGSPPPSLNLTIEAMHVQQVVQTYGGTVPLVANRSGLLRVFVKASTSNTVSPTVRVRFYNGATLTNTISITAPASVVPTSPSQGTITGSWNYVIPGNAMVPGLKILADVDPTNGVVESSEADNSFPTNGTPLAMDVRSLSAFDVRFVPVTQSANGLTGGVTAGNASQYLSWTQKVYPIDAVTMDVRSPYTTNAPALQDDDSNGAWGQVLSELNALRTADGSTKYYAGIAKVTYGSGIAGLGYLPGRASLSWDYLPSSSEVVAHELGHNFGRAHAPCGGAGGPDPSYPYSGGQIGVYGYDVAASALKAPTLTDLMGYCNSNWISDYNYVAVMNYRIANPYVAMARAVGSRVARPGLLVWGRIRRGQVILEPAFEVNAPPSLPTTAGPHRLQAFGPLGQALADFSFEGEAVGDEADPTARHFAFVIPLDLLGGSAPDRLRLSAQGRTAERRSAAAANATREVPRAEREGARGLRVRWADPTIAGVMVRDARTGEILSFARGGDQGVVSSARDVDLVVSDGVRSTRSRVPVGPPRQ